MKKGDLVYSTRRKGVGNKPVGIILGFSIDFLIHRYDEPEYKVFWQKTGHISDNVQKKYLRRVTDESR